MTHVISNVVSNEDLFGSIGHCDERIVDFHFARKEISTRGAGVWGNFGRPAKVVSQSRLVSQHRKFRNFFIHPEILDTIGIKRALAIMNPE